MISFLIRKALAAFGSSQFRSEAKEGQAFAVREDSWDKLVKIRIGAGDMFTLLSAAMPILAEAEVPEGVVEKLYSDIAIQLERQDVVEFHDTDQLEQVDYENSHPHDEIMDGGYL